MLGDPDKDLSQDLNKDLSKPSFLDQLPLFQNLKQSFFKTSFFGHVLKHTRQASSEFDRVGQKVAERALSIPGAALAVDKLDKAGPKVRASTIAMLAMGPIPGGIPALLAWTILKRARRRQLSAARDSKLVTRIDEVT